MVDENWVHAPPTKNCSNLDYDNFLLLSNDQNDCKWFCPTCIFACLPDSNLELLEEQLSITENLTLQLDDETRKFINSCQNLITQNSDDDDDADIDNIFTIINSKYYDLSSINKLKTDLSSLGILHTNFASLYKYHDELELLSIYPFINP